MDKTLPQQPEENSQTRKEHLNEVIRVFLRLGATAFGGPAAHVALMREELVGRRKWVTEQHFLDLLGATNLIPGPNSTEMAIHLGFVRAGYRGLVAAGASFILPAMIIVIAIAWAYQRFGQTPELSWLMYGIKPVVMAIIVQALWKLGRQAIAGPLTATAGIIVMGLYLVGINELLLLFSAGLMVMLVRNIPDGWPGGRLRGLRSIAWLLPGFGLQAASSQVPFSLSLLFFTFLKIGSVLYGGGYVLLAFLQSDFVERLGWLTQDQLIEAVAVGQVTPGPLFTTATFIGYIMGGLPGALLGTLGIFLPSFLLVALTNPLIPRMRSSPWAGALLDGVNAASLGLMAGVTLELMPATIVDPLTVGLAAGAALLLFRTRINATWLILAGGLVGLAHFLLS